MSLYSNTSTLTLATLFIVFVLLVLWFSNSVGWHISLNDRAYRILALRVDPKHDCHGDPNLITDGVAMSWLKWCLVNFMCGTTHTYGVLSIPCVAQLTHGTMYSKRKDWGRRQGLMSEMIAHDICQGLMSEMSEAPRCKKTMGAASPEGAH